MQTWSTHLDLKRKVFNVKTVFGLYQPRAHHWGWCTWQSFSLRPRGSGTPTMRVKDRPQLPPYCGICVRQWTVSALAVLPFYTYQYLWHINSSWEYKTIVSIFSVLISVFLSPSLIASLTLIYRVILGCFHVFFQQKYKMTLNLK